MYMPGLVVTYRPDHAWILISEQGGLNYYSLNHFICIPIAHEARKTPKMSPLWSFPKLWRPKKHSVARKMPTFKFRLAKQLTLSKTLNVASGVRHSRLQRLVCRSRRRSRCLVSEADDTEDCLVIFWNIKYHQYQSFV